MKRGRASTKPKPRILFGDDDDDRVNDDNILITCTKSTRTLIASHQYQQEQQQQQQYSSKSCNINAFTSTTTTTTTNNNNRLISSQQKKRNSLQNHHHNPYSECEKENYSTTLSSPVEKKVKTCHSILLCSPPAAADSKYKSILNQKEEEEEETSIIAFSTNNKQLQTTPTRVLNFGDDHLSSLDDDCGQDSTPNNRNHDKGHVADDDEEGEDDHHGFILTPPSSTLSRASSRRISLTPPSTGRLSSGSDSIRRNLDFSLCCPPSSLRSMMMTTAQTPCSSSGSGGGDLSDHHTFLSPFVSQFSISSPKIQSSSATKKNRPTNILLPRSSPAKPEEEEEEDSETPLISPLLLTSMDDVFGVEATRRDVEAYRDFSEPSRRLAQDLNDGSDEDASPSFNTNVQLKLETITHPKISGCNAITSKTLLEALRSKSLKHQIRIIDCRFAHEYDGGHIQGALSIWTPDMLIQQFFSSSMHNSQQEEILVFHCEYSQARAPKMYRFMREYDRKIHEHEYPRLSFPDIYVLEGGYKAFWEEDEENKSFCEPMNYVAMDDNRYTEQCKVSYQSCKNAWRRRKTQKSSFL